MINNIIKSEEFKLNIFNLNFLSKEKEKKFRTAYFENSLTQLRVSFVILSLLYISFGILDKIVAPEHLNEFLLIRFVIVFPLLASVPVISYFDIFKKIWQPLLIICFVIGGSGIIYMLAKIPDNLFYFGGLFLVFMAGFFLIRLRFLAAAFSSIIIILIYNIILIVLETRTSLDQNYLLLSNPFFIATAVIGTTALYYIERLERLDFHQKELLIENKKEIENINSKLEQQVFERTKEIEQRNKELHEEIKRKEKIEKELIKAKEKAEESDHLKSAFLQNMSHEIRTPMNAICGFAGILKKPNLADEKKQNFIAIIQNSSNQLLSIVTDILTISSLDTKQEKLNIKPVSIKNLINDLFLVFKSQARNKNIAFRINPQGNENNSEIYTDGSKLTQVISNLITNALKFTHEGFIEFGYLIKPANDPTEIEFYIKDSGIGIETELHEKIFERFRQADMAINKKYGGTGLGLSISKGLVELLGGKIWVQSEIGKGATFYFTTPYHPVKIKTGTAQAAELFLNDATILVAEDEEYNFQLIQELLHGRNLNIIHAKNGKEAVEICKSNSAINLILMDIKMPEMDGYTAAKMIKKIFPKLPVIAQSAYALDHEIEKYSVIFDDYITKPIDEDKLIAKLSKFLNNI